MSLEEIKELATTKQRQQDRMDDIIKEIDRVLQEASYLDPHSKEYSEIAENVEKEKTKKEGTKSDDSFPLRGGSLKKRKSNIILLQLQAELM